MNTRIRFILSALFVVVGVILLLTGIGGGGFDFTTGEWSLSATTTPTENRIVGVLMIVFGVLFSRVKTN